MIGSPASSGLRGWVPGHGGSHLRRRFVKEVKASGSPVAETAIARIAALYPIEAGLRGAAPETRLAARRTKAAPIVAALKPWFGTQLSRRPRRSQRATDIRYALACWQGLIRFLEDGRLELHINPVENQIRPIAPTRNDAPFTGHEGGAENWALLGSIIAPRKLNAFDPVACLTATLVAIPDGHPRPVVSRKWWKFEGGVISG